LIAVESEGGERVKVLDGTTVWVGILAMGMGSGLVAQDNASGTQTPAAKAAQATQTTPSKEHPETASDATSQEL